MKKILLINPFGIGDVLFTTPVVQALKHEYPDSFIGYWSNLRVAPILESNPQINKVFALSRGDLKKICQESCFKGLSDILKFIWKLKKERFDICLDFSLDHRYSLLAKLIGIKTRTGFNYKGRGRFLTRRVDLAGYQNKHVVEYYLDLLKLLNIPPEKKDLVLNVSREAKRQAGNLLVAAGIKETDCLIGLFPGAGGSWGKDAAIKHWPVLNFAQVGNRLIEQLGAKILILGDVSEKSLSETIFQAMVKKPVDLTGKTGLEILPAIIKNCDLVITNDGGPMHMAAALGVKSVSIFGPVSEVVYGPYPPSNRHAVLKTDLECRPCYNNFRLAVCEKERACLKQVSVEEVFNAAIKLLN